MFSDIQGTGVALVTPFDKNGSVDFSGLERLLKHVSNNNIDYLVVNGTTGESATTTSQEKKEVLGFVKKNSGNLPIVFGLGGNNTEEILKKFDYYDLSGISAILSVCPYYNKPSQEGIYQHYKMIAEASPVPLILYNVPGRTGVNIKAETTLRLAEIANITAIKEASGDLYQALAISKCDREDFVLISGDDLLTVPMMAIGAKGVISVLANAFPGHFSDMVQKARTGQFAEAADMTRLFLDINPYIYEEGNPVGIKTVLELMEIIPNSNVRLPLAKSSSQLRKKIETYLRELEKITKIQS